jgi:hypothetical protein
MEIGGIESNMIESEDTCHSEESGGVTHEEELGQACRPLSDLFIDGPTAIEGFKWADQIKRLSPDLLNKLTTMESTPGSAFEAALNGDPAGMTLFLEEYLPVA